MFGDPPATGHIDHFYDKSDRDMEMRLYADRDRECSNRCQRFRPRARRQIKHEIQGSDFNERESCIDQHSSQLFAKLQKTYATVGSTAAQATEYTHAERARDKGHPRPRQHDQGSGSPASGRVNHSPVLSPTSGEFRNWLTAAHRERASPPNIVGVTSEEPETPASDETYEPSDELPDYATPVGTIIPRIEVDSLDSSTTPSSLNSETPEGPVRGCQIDAPHWVRHASARSSSSL
ncbi:hypothetical protein IG631_23557 [Alternaria alternata]|nr:hypothetical protein IG631_23557 [Alternaria alternata]